MPSGTEITIQAQDSSFVRQGGTGQTITYGVFGGYPILNTVVPSLITISKPTFSPTPRVGSSNLSAIISSLIGPADLSAIVSNRVGRADLTTAVSPRVGASNLAAVLSTRVGPSDLSLIVSPRVGADTLIGKLTPRIGLPNLATIFDLGPLDTTFENSTEALYDRSFAIARATALSGPTNVRGGTARQGFELAELDTQMGINRYREVWQNQVAWARVVEDAIKMSNDIITGYDTEVITATKTVNDILADYDREIMEGTKISNDILLEADKVLIAATKTSNDILADFDREVMEATQISNAILKDYDLEIQSGTEITNRMRSDYDRRIIDGTKTSNDILVAFDAETQNDNEQSIMAQHANAVSVNNYYNQINNANATLVQSFAAGRHYGQTAMNTLEEYSGSGVQSGPVNGFGMSSWR